MRDAQPKPPKLLDQVRREKTMIYTHVLQRGGRGVTSPLDRL